MSRNIDGGWAWVILTCGFCSFILNGFLCYSMGVITEAMLEVFDGDLTLTSAVGSAVVGAQCCTGPIAGIFSKKIGCRPCAILGGIIATAGLCGASVSGDLYTVMVCGIITGIGYGLPFTSCSVIVGLYFHRLRPLAAGIAMTGAGLGMFAGPPLVRYLIDQYGLHGTFLIMAGISFHFCIIGSLLRPLSRAEDITMKPSQQKVYVSHSKSAFQRYCVESRTCDSFHSVINAGFMLYLLSIFLWSVAESACLLHLPNYCIQEGSSKTDTALLFTVMGVGNILSRLLTGFAANDERVHNITFHAGQLGVVSIFTGLFPLYSRTYGGQLAFSAALGIYTSGVNSLYNPIVVQLVGLDALAIGFGMVNFAAGTGYLTGSPIAGAIVDYGATYTESYIFAGFVYLLASMSAMIIPLFHSERDDHVIPRISSSHEITIPLEGSPEKSHLQLNNTYISDYHTQEKDTLECEEDLLQ